MTAPGENSRSVRWKRRSGSPKSRRNGEEIAQIGGEGQQVTIDVNRRVEVRQRDKTVRRRQENEAVGIRDRKVKLLVWSRLHDRNRHLPNPFDNRHMRVGSVTEECQAPVELGVAARHQLAFSATGVRWQLKAAR